MAASPLSWRGKLYIGSVFLAGMAAVTASVHSMQGAGLGYSWILLAVLTWVTGPFAIKVPTIAATISVSEAFVFTSVLLYGPGPATLTVALDGLFTSIYRNNHAPRRVLFNTTEPAVSCWLAGQLFFWAAGVPPLAQAQGDMIELFLPVALLGTASFLLNSGLTAVAVWTETGASPLTVWRKHFMWLSLNHFGGASIAILLAVNMRIVTFGSLLAIVPLLVILYLTFQSWTLHLEDTNRHLKELNELYMATVESLATAVDAKDQVTHGHIRRVQTFSVRLARALGLSNELEIKALETAALLHDMGKLAIPDYILNKPGKLTSSEYDKMKLHAAAGAEILAAVDFPYPVVPVVRHHHEAWDGSGYPDGISGSAIPIGARILSVVDCYDALTSDRPYRPAMTQEQALKIIKERAGTMYDPLVVNALAQGHREICAPIDVDAVPQNTVIAQIIGACREPWEAAAKAGEVVGGNLGGAILGLCDVGDAAAGQAAFADLAELCARQLRRAAPASLVAFYMVDSDSQQVVLRYASGYGEDRLAGLRIDLGEGLSGWVATNRTTMVNSDPRLDLGARIDGFESRPESALVTALVVGHEAVGVLALYGMKPEAFTASHTEVAELVARQIAPVLHRALAFTDEAESTLRDRATGLPNRLYLDRLVISPGFRDSQIMRSLGVLRISIVAAAEFGSRPDDLIRHLAVAATQAVRVADMVFRSDELEVAVLMPDCDPAAGARVEARVVAALDAIIRPPVVRVGFAGAPLDGNALDRLLDVAHARMDRSGRVAGGDPAVAREVPAAAAAVREGARR